MMFGFGKEEREQKKIEELHRFCASYSHFCMERVCKITGKAITDDEIRKIFSSDDSIQFWYSVALTLTYQAGFGDESKERGDLMALILGTKILMVFQGLYDNELIDRAIALQKSGQEKYNTGERDRNVKVHVAAATAARDLWTTKEIGELPMHLYVTYICKLDDHVSPGGASFAEIDEIMGE